MSGSRLPHADSVREPERLDSWKAIANHLGRTVRTVQRWERMGLPVHRHEHLSGSSVYAYASEIDWWWASRRPEEPALLRPAIGGRADTQMPRIAVLPFLMLDDTPDEPYFGDGFLEELIATLARARAVSVISRTSVMRFRDRSEIPLARIAAMLSATLIVEGSVQRTGDAVLVSIRLVDPHDAGRILWADHYRCRRSGIHHLQTQVAQDLVDVAARRDRRPGETLAPGNAVVPEAHDAYLMGRYYLHKRTAAALALALERFQQVTAFDPADARGDAGLAETYMLLSGNEFWPPSAGFPKAREAAARALDRDPGNAVAHASLGMVKALYDWDWSGADREFDVAIDLNPNYAEAFHWQGVTRLMSGLIAESMPPLARAVELDPLSPIILVNSGRPSHFLGRFDEAIAWCDRALAQAPDFWTAHYNRAMALAAMGDAPAALAAARRAVETSHGKGPTLLVLAEAHAVAGNAPEALRTIAEAIGSAQAPAGSPTYVNPFRVARVFARLGDADAALDWLNRSYAERSLGNSTYASLDPAIDPLRDHPRFQRLMEALGVAPDARIRADRFPRRR
ncbi:MAG TPA: tetratricopeptide repeat protein [Vicinamibacterales bacterium]|nr:tetratricopeptide repeat protein [Vicinamibacterales bacterium]